ncbi:MAG: hypothetical protein M3326_16550 [Actinomycetota bacterium]|nr:hypothetical protein [Actinomycetota bacterium]
MQWDGVGCVGIGSPETLMAEHSAPRAEQLTGPSNPSEQDVIAGGMSSLWRIVSAVVAPATLTTALLFYFGWTRTRAVAAYFGVDHTTLGFSAQDYILRSIDAIFLPLGALLLVALILSWNHSVLMRAADTGRLVSIVRRVPVVATIFGLACLLYGLPTSMTGAGGRLAFVGPLSVAAGMVALGYATHLRRRLHGASRGMTTGADMTSLPWAVLSLLVVLNLFWAASYYANMLGDQRGRELAARLVLQPDAIVYSEKALSIQEPGVTEMIVGDEDAAFRFRYDGLKLWVHSGKKYFFIPETWGTLGGAVVMLREDDVRRVDFIATARQRHLSLR